MSDQEFGAVLNAHNMPSPTAVKSVSAIEQAQATPKAAGTITNGQDRNGSSMGPPSTGMTPVSDPTKKPSSGSSSSSSKDPSRHKDGHKSSSGHHSSSASKSNGDSSHSKDHHKHSSSHSSSSSSSRPHSSSGSATKEQDKHRVSSSSTSSSSAHKDKEHSKSKDHHSSSASKSHSSSSSSGDKSHGSSKKPDGSSSSSSKPKEDSSKSKHGSFSSSSHKASDGKDKDRHHSSKSSSSDKPRDKSHSSSSSVKPSLSMESASNVSVKMEGSSIKMKIEMSPSKTSTTQDVKTPVVKTEPHLPPVKVKVENPLADYTDDDDEDELPLSERMKVKPEPVNSAKRKRADSDEDSDTPLSERKKKVKSEPVGKKRKLEDDDFKPKKNVKPSKTAVKMEDDESVPKRGKKAKVEEEEHNWRWWEEETKEEGVKWKTLEHKGPVFAPPYEPLPANVKFYYDGKVINLSPEAEEIAGFYARMLDHDYTTRDLFNNNFLKDWRKKMTPEERSLITNLSKCNFREYYDYFKIKTEERKGMSKEEKLVIKKENERLQKEYGFCIIDGHKQKIGNFKIEPPGLFRGRGDHPKQGMLKQRVVPEDVMINCSKGSNVPAPPPGHKWKEVRHDNTVTWLASWTENVQGQNKYVMLNAASKLKGEKDWNKYETARKLHKLIHKIRNTYKEDWKSKEMRIRQRSVALYFIDKLALRAGNEKDEDTADTVGCCSLRVEHIKLHEKYDDQECVVEFDFLGKDSIRYYNRVPVEKRVFKNLQLFVDNKQGNDDLFDRLNTGILNKHLQTLMDGLTAKVFRTYNASHTLQQQLDLLSQSDDFGDEPIAAKILAYNRANRAVAILCNHQRAAPKNFDKQMENLQSKIDAKNELIKNAKKELKDAKTDAKHSKSETTKANVVKKEKALERLKEQLGKLEVQATDKDENKEIALGTSKLNYLDPRISIAWCKKWDVPIEKVYNKTQREKFAWAISMATADYQF